MTIAGTSKLVLFELGDCYVCLDTTPSVEHLGIDHFTGGLINIITADLLKDRKGILALKNEVCHGRKIVDPYIFSDCHMFGYLSSRTSSDDGNCIHIWVQCLQAQTSWPVHIRIIDRSRHPAGPGDRGKATYFIFSLIF